MPHGLKRFQNAESLHFIPFSCFHRLPLLQSAEAKEAFETVLEQVRARHQTRVYGYVVRPQHVHLLVSEPRRARLSTAEQALKLSVSMRSLVGPCGRPIPTISTSTPMRSLW